MRYWFDLRELARAARIVIAIFTGAVMWEAVIFPAFVIIFSKLQTTRKYF